MTPTPRLSGKQVTKKDKKDLRNQLTTAPIGPREMAKFAGEKIYFYVRKVYVTEEKELSLKFLEAV